MIFRIHALAVATAALLVIRSVVRQRLETADGAAQLSSAQLRVRNARGRTLAGVNGASNARWVGPYCFVALADPQLGMLHGDKSWDEELGMLHTAIDHINRLTPAFVVVLGDLVNAFSLGPRKDAQAAALKRALARIAPGVPLLLLPGNHDVGNAPGPDLLAWYGQHFGDDYYSVTIGGVRYVVLNSNFFADAQRVPTQAAAQRAWLDETLAAPLPHAGEIGGGRTVIFAHHPLFIGSATEGPGYFNTRPEYRAELISKFEAAGVSDYMCGHFHRNAGGLSRPGGLRCVVSAAVGTVLTGEGPDKLHLKGVGDLACGAKLSGLRLVHVLEDELRSKFFALADVPEAFDASSTDSSAGWT